MPDGIAAMSVEEAVKAAEQLPGPLYVVKAQIHAGDAAPAISKIIPKARAAFVCARPGMMFVMPPRR